MLATRTPPSSFISIEYVLICGSANGKSVQAELGAKNQATASQDCNKNHAFNSKLFPPLWWNLRRKFQTTCTFHNLVVYIEILQGLTVRDKRIGRHTKTQPVVSEAALRLSAPSMLRWFHDCPQNHAVDNGDPCSSRWSEAC